MIPVLPDWGKKYRLAINRLKRERLQRLVLFKRVNLEKYPDYENRISPNRPMDFSLIKAKLDSG
eukprot:2442339-Amphidinium_carterae.1